MSALHAAPNRQRLPILKASSQLNWLDDLFSCLTHCSIVEWLDIFISSGSDGSVSTEGVASQDACIDQTGSQRNHSLPPEIKRLLAEMTVNPPVAIRASMAKFQRECEYLSATPKHPARHWNCATAAYNSIGRVERVAQGSHLLCETEVAVDNMAGERDLLVILSRDRCIRHRNYKPPAFPILSSLQR